MSKVIVTSTNDYLEEVIETLHSMKVVHIVDHKTDEDADIGSPLDKGEEISEILVKVRSLKSLLKIKEGNDKKKIEDNNLTIKKNLVEIHKKTNDNINSIKEIEDKIKQIQNKINDLDIAIKLELPLEAFTNFDSLKSIFGYVKNIDEIEEKVQKITDNYEIFHDKETKLCAIFFQKRIEEKLLKIVENENLQQIELSLNDLEGNAKVKKRELEKKIQQLNKEKESIVKEMDKERLSWKDYILSLERIMIRESDKAEAPLRFASTEKTFTLQGWIPEKKTQKLNEKLEEITKGKISIRTNSPTKKDSVPAKMNNPKVVDSFETLMELYALPKYREFDPTFLVFITFPFLFGFMLGDWGYGLVTLILFYSLKKMIPAGKNFFNILMLSSLSTIFFGFLFGEFFGAEILFGWDMPRILSRTHQYMILLYIAVIIGVIHINFGVIMGFLNEKRMHGLKAAIFEKGSWFVIETGAAFIALSMLGIWRLQWYIGLIIILIGSFMLYKGEGFHGVIEIPGIFSNILSYARLMALGLASVKLAEVINEFAGTFFSNGGMGIVAAILLLIIGHMINIALGIIGPFLHSLRLHYVEFFTKFYKGGAKKFRAFGAKN